MPSSLVLGVIIVLGIAGAGLTVVYLSPSETDPTAPAQPRFNTDPIPDTSSQGALHQGENMTAVTGDDFEGLGSNLGGDRLSVTTTAEPSTSTESSTATLTEKQTATQPAATSKTEEAATTSKQEQLTEAKTQLGEKKETTTTSDTLERITIGLPFDPKNPPNELQPMGETINHEAEHGGHPGIDFQWIADEPPKLYASAKGIIVEIIEEPPDWTLTLSHTGFDREYYTRYGLGSYDTSLEIGDEVEKGMFLGHVPSPHPEDNMYGTHWEFGFACLGEQCNYGFHGDRLCPMTYFDEDSRTIMGKIWASAPYDAKDQFPHICSGSYYEKDG